MLVNIGEGGKPGGEWSNTGGHYEDRYVKTTQGWKFKRREYIPMKSERRAPGTTAMDVAEALSRAGDGERQYIRNAAIHDTSSRYWNSAPDGW